MISRAMRARSFTSSLSVAARSSLRDVSPVYFASAQLAYAGRQPRGRGDFCPQFPHKPPPSLSNQTTRELFLGSQFQPIAGADPADSGQAR